MTKLTLRNVVVSQCVHALVSRDSKTITARCGFVVTIPSDWRLPAEFTAWESKVTCQECSYATTS